MNLNEYFDQYPTEHIMSVAKEAGTSLGYLRGCRYGQRRMSADLAIWLDHVTNGEMDAAELRPDLPWPHAKPNKPKPATPDPN